MRLIIIRYSVLTNWRRSRSAIWFGAERPLCPLNSSIFYFLLTCFQQQLCDCLFFFLAMHIETSRITFRMWSNDPIADLQLPRSPKPCDLPAKRNILRWLAGYKSSCNRLSWNKLTSWWYQKGSSWWEPDRQQGDRLLSVRCTGRGGQRDGGWTSQSGSTRTPICTFKGRHLVCCRHLGKTTTQRRCLPEWQLNGAIINVIRGRQRSPWYDKGNAPEFTDDPEALNII